VLHKRAPQKKEISMILVVGATGTVGGAITRILMEQGKSVRILVRLQSNYRPIAEAGAQVILGDLKERASLDPACADVETVITTANSAQRGGDDNPETVDSEGNRNLIDAAKEAGVKQFIFVSTHLADASSPVPFFQAKGKTEDHLRASGLPYTIVAPNLFMEVWVATIVSVPAMKDEPVTVVGEGSRKHSFISESDVAPFIVATVGHPAALNQKLLIGGPEPLSFRDAAAIYGRVLGYEVPVRSVAPGEPILSLPQLMAQMLTVLDTFDSPMDMTQLIDTFGVKLTSLEEVARKASAGANRARSV
jgi:uncharacterized protein YbjT (DUF2867 family)